MKVVINTCFGGFGLSQKATALYAEQKGIAADTVYDYDIERNDPILVAIVEQMGEKAGGSCSRLKVVEIPDDVQWQVEEYDGAEHIAEVHRTWS